LLELIHLNNVGPAPEMEMPLTPRLNLITGDNGLGKSFLLDVAWWALTRTWARGTVIPHAPPAVPAISYRYRAKSATPEHTSRFDRATERWILKQSRPPIPGLVLYAQVDGGFSVWDPARNYWRKGDPDRPSSYLFTPHEVWEGNTLCEGLIRDWASWQREGRDAYTQLQRVLHALSPSPSEPIEAGELRKITLDDPKRYPTLKMPYGQDVAVIHASAGMRRIIALAYLLVWTWQEHLGACQLRGEPPTKEVIFLVDEVEAHLHPQWQRRIVPAILEVMAAITGEHSSNVQLIAATHSPLVLASVETLFDPEKDAWFDLDLVSDNRMVALEKRPFVRRGDVSNWLTSEAFDLKEARSLEAEQAITQAHALSSTDSPSKEDIERVDALLSKSLSDIDRFWLRWSAFRRNLEVPQ
jgi:hypothetical protein